MCFFLQKKGNGVTIHIDATGNIVQQPSANTKRAFYYSAVVAIKTNENDKHFSVFPVSEFISTSHTTDDVGLWLRKFRHFVTNGVKQWPVFNRVVTDESWVQLHALCEDWNFMSFTNYIKITHNWANQIKTAIDRTELVIITLCTAHKIKNIVKDVHQFLSSSNSKLIIEILASMVNINSYTTIKTIWALLSLILKSQRLTKNVKDAINSISEIIFPNIAIQISESLESSADKDSAREEKYEDESKNKLVRKFN